MSLRHFSLRYVVDPSESPPRVAFATPRTLGGAVARNRVRRRLRVILGDETPPAGLYLIRVKPSAIGAAFSELSASWGQACERVSHS